MAQRAEMEMVASELVSFASQSVRQCLSSLPDSTEEDQNGFVVKDEIIPERLNKPNQKVRLHVAPTSAIASPTPILRTYDMTSG